MICAYDVVEQLAIALPYSARNKKIQRNVRTCVFFEYGSYMFCIAYMICGYDVVEQLAIAYIGRNKKKQRNVRTWVCDVVLYIFWFAYVLCSMYDICE